jgi:hypothetical protein
MLNVAEGRPEFVEKLAEKERGGPRRDRPLPGSMPLYCKVN